MSRSFARVRSGRSAPVIAVTPASSPAGRAIVAGLERHIGRPGGPGAVLAVDADPTTSAVRSALDGARVVVHVANTADQACDPRTATERRAHAVRSVQEVSAAAVAVGAQRLVVVTSAMVHGAGGPVPVPDDAPPADRREEGQIGDLLEVERIVARLSRVHPELRTTVVRPAALVGPDVDTIFTRHLEAPRLLALRGEQMRWQFCHVDDLAEAVAIVIEQGLDGALGAGGVPWLTDAEVERLTGMRRVELPARLAFATAERLRRTGRVSTPASDLAFVVQPWVVSSERLYAAGWQPRHDATSCVLGVRERFAASAAGPASSSDQGPSAVDGGSDVTAGTTSEVRRVDPREAALGAAGAAVAILGTAALLRQARARRTGRPRPRL